MPLGAARIALLAKTQVVAAAEVIRRKVGVTALGNAQVDTAQSKFGGASALFDGTDDALQITDLSWIDWNSDFTVELWIRMSAYGEQVFFDTREGTGGDGTGGYLVRDASSVLRFYLNATSIVSKTDPNITTNTWYHVAVTRSGNDFDLWIDGTSVSSATSSATGTAYKFYIGRNSYSAGSGNTVGHIDEFRFSNTARYTTTFTPSTTPFVNDDNTKLLLHMDGTDGSTYFEDDNGVGRSSVGCTFVSTAAISTSDSKFSGSSLFLDGNWSTTNAMVNVGQGSSTNGTFNTGTGDFTVECWFNTDTVGSVGIILDLRPSDNTSVGPALYHNLTDIKLYAQGADRITGAGLISAGTWYHIALSRSSGTSKFFLDGTQVGSDYADTNNYGSHGIGLGTVHSSAGGSANFEGYIDEVRFSNTARYTAAFTPSTTPFVNDANTLFLGHFNGTNNSTLALDDNGVGRSQVGMVATSGAAVDTAQYKFGGASAYFNASSLDMITLPQPSTGYWNVGTDWTFECWYRPTSRSGTYPVIVANHTTTWAAGDWGLFDRHDNATTKFTWQMNSYSSSLPMLESTTTVSNGTWYHIAVVKSGNNYALYINGTSEDTATLSGGTATSRDLRLGSSGNATSKTVNGHIDEVRISNSARYTTTFTPDTTPFQNDANTLLLMHADGTDGSTDFIDDNGKESA